MFLVLTELNATEPYFKLLMKSMINKVTFICVGIAICFFSCSECKHFKLSEDSKSVLGSFNINHNGFYNAYERPCSPEVYIKLIDTARIDSALFHRLLVEIIQTEKKNHKIRILDKDSMLMYIEYGMILSGDTSYHVVDDYGY